MSLLRFVSAVWLCGSLPLPAYAQAPAPADPQPAEKSGGGRLPLGLVFGASVDGYYGFNFNRVAGDAPLRNFDTRHDRINLGLAEAVVERAPTSTSRFGFRVDLDAGRTADLVAAFEPSGAGRYGWLQQAYVTYLAPVGRGLTLDVGKIVTPLGAELIESQDNWNYSRSLLFALAIPYYHTGARASYAFTDRVAVSGMLVQGWNAVRDNNGAKTIVLQATVKPSPRVSLVQNFITGAEQADNTKDRRHVLDTVATVTVSDRLSLMANYDYGRDQVDGLAARWQGVALYGRWQAASWWALAPRVEWYKDGDGFTTGAPQTVRELTLTSEQTLAGRLLTRLEYRRDMATTPFFTGESGPTDTQSTVTFGFVYTFRTARP